MAMGERIKTARKKKGLTQKQLAGLIGAKHNSISNWENNQNKPDPDMIESLCGILDVTPSFLISGTDTIVDTSLNNISKSSQARRLLAYFEKLNHNGKKKAIERVEELTYISMYRQDESEHLTVNAAHIRTDIEVTKEMKKHDDDIMNDDSIWN